MHKLAGAVMQRLALPLHREEILASNLGHSLSAMSVRFPSTCSGFSSKTGKLVTIIARMCMFMHLFVFMLAPWWTGNLSCTLLGFAHHV